MALFTTNLSVRAIQFERKQIMVDLCGIPIIRGMANRAIRAKFTVMFIILLMTGITIFGRACEDIIPMTISASNIGMFAFQFEVGQIMVKSCVIPTIRIMTRGAILSEPASMFIILLMTRETILRRRLQIRNGTRIEVAFRACHISVFAIQLKCKSGMFEITAKSIHAIVTRETICPEGQDVCLGETNVHLTVATVTCVWSEGFYILLMTIATSERFARRR